MTCGLVDDDWRLLRICAGLLFHSAQDQRFRVLQEVLVSSLMEVESRGLRLCYHICIGSQG